jgi:hypothetical protein
MFRGTIAFFCGDNLGSQFIGGFKEGSRAHRVCRECMGTQIQISICVSVKKVTSSVLLWTALDIYTYSRLRWFFLYPGKYRGFFKRTASCLHTGEASLTIWSCYANLK